MAWDNELVEANEQYSFSELKQDKEVEEFNKQADEFDKEQEQKTKSKGIEIETILMFSQPKVGKTWAGCSFIEQTLKDKGHVWYINTDNGFKKTAKAYFKNKYEDMMKSLTLDFISNLDELDGIIKKIKKNVKSNDLIIIDLIDDFYEKAQIRVTEDMAKSLNMSIIDFMILSNKEGKIGNLSMDKWTLIKRYDNLLINELVISPPCNVIACCSAKDIDVAKIFAKKDADKMYELSKYDEIGSRPAGQKLLATKFNTIIYIGEKKDGKRYFLLTGDRGFMKSKDKVEYQDNFYEAFMRLRK